MRETRQPRRVVLYRCVRVARPGISRGRRTSQGKSPHGRPFFPLVRVDTYHLLPHDKWIDYSFEGLSPAYGLSITYFQVPSG